MLRRIGQRAALGTVQGFRGVRRLAYSVRKYALFGFSCFLCAGAEHVLVCWCGV